MQQGFSMQRGKQKFKSKEAGKKTLGCATLKTGFIYVHLIALGHLQALGFPVHWLF